jgi:hypothetical protein
MEVWMRKLLATVVAAVALGGGVASVALAEPGPNGSNEHGLCTAYFNGQKNGHDKNGNPPPFQALIDAASDGDEETPVEEDVYNYCQEFGIGGNPEHGRYPDLFGNDDEG